MGNLRNLFKYCLLLALTGSAYIPVSASAGNNPLNSDTAVRHLQEGNRELAIRQLTQLAYEGNIAAQFNLGVIHVAGTDQEIGQQEARFWFQRAAQEGDDDAQYNLALLILEQPATESRDLAVSWLERSATSGNIKAQVNLGILALWNANFPVSDIAGIGLLEAAIESGDPVASQALSMWRQNVSREDALANLYPMELDFHSDSIRKRSRVKRSESLVYALPTSRQEPILQLPENYEVEVISKTNGWAQVKLAAGLPAWMLTSHVDISGKTATVKLLESGLYVDPEIDLEVYRLGTVIRGETLLILEQRQGWIKVESPLRFAGWMRENDVEVLPGSVATKIPAAVKSAPKQQDIPSQPATAKTASIAIDSIDIVANTIVYSENSTSFTPLGRTVKSFSVKIQQESGEMVRISVQGPLYGWVYYSLVTPDGNGGVINKSRANVRLDPDSSLDNIITVRHSGDHVLILDKVANWYQIVIEAEQGWVSTRVLDQ